MSEKEYIDFKKEFEEFKKELESSKPMFDDDLKMDFPKIALETDDILMNLIIKKDYSTIDDLEKRKEEFIKDLKEFIDEFDSTEESTELMKYYD